jgi:N-acetyl-anhydromuramyl-L-alanine amidase AmpD
MSHAFLKKTFNNRIAWKSSPNFGLRKLPIKAIVVHYTQMPHDAALEKLCDPSSQVSAHFLIKEDGFITLCAPQNALGMQGLVV